MRKRRIVSLLLVTPMVATILASCSKTESNVTTYPEQEIVEEITEAEEVPTPVTKEPFTHAYYKRYKNVESRYDAAEEVEGGSIEIPEGYEILDIEPWVRSSFRTAQTGGFDVWFINNKTVEVTPVYNESTGEYELTEPGIVVEETLEETDPALKLTQ